MHQIPRIGPVTGTGAAQLRQILAPIPRVTKRRPPDEKGDGGADDPTGEPSGACAGYCSRWNRSKTMKRAAAQATEAAGGEGKTGGSDEKQGLVTDASASYKLEIWDQMRP